MANVRLRIDLAPLRARAFVATALGVLATMVSPHDGVCGEVDVPAAEDPASAPATAPAGNVGGAPGETAETSTGGEAAAAEAAGSVAHFEIAALAGYLTPPIRGGTTPFGAGLSGRFGLVVSNVYVGGKVSGYLGGTDVDISDLFDFYGLEAGYGFRADAFRGTHIVVRPYVGAGGVSIFHTDPSLAGTGTTTPTATGGGGRTRPDVDVISAASVSSSSGGGSGTSVSTTTTVTNVYVEPGVSVVWTSGAVFVGALGSVVVVPGIPYSGAEPSTWVSYGVAGQVGLSF